MPIPKRKKNENKSNYISRCISTLSKIDFDKSQDQIAAMCYNTLKRGKEAMLNKIELSIIKKARAITPKDQKSPKMYMDPELVDNSVDFSSKLFKYGRRPGYGILGGAGLGGLLGYILGKDWESAGVGSLLGGVSLPILQQLITKEKFKGPWF